MLNKFTLIFLLVAFKFSPLYPQKVNAQYGTNGSNYSLLERGNKLYIGGNFTEVGKKVCGFACVDLINGKFIPGNTFRSNYNINCVIEDDTGGYYVGGDFQYLNDSSAYGLAHVLKDGSLDKSFNYKIRTTYGDASIKFLHKMGDTLFVVGNIDSVNDQHRNNFFGINLKTHSLLSWNPNIGGTITSITHNNNYLFLAGGIDSYEKNIVLNFVQLSRKDLSYSYAIGYDKQVDALVLDSSRVIAKGNYSFSCWANTGLIMADTSDIEHAIFGLQLNGYVNKVEANPKGGWFVAGNFTVDNYPSIANLLKLKADYSIDTTFKYKFSNQILDMVVIDSFVFCASEATTVNGKFYNQIAIINYINNTLAADKVNMQKMIQSLYSFKNELIVRTWGETFRISIPDFKMLDVPYGDFDVKVDSNYLYLTNGQGFISYGNTNLSLFSNSGKFSKIKAKQYLSTCNAAISDENGGWFIAGNGIRHILADGSSDPTLSFDIQSGVTECLLKRGDSLFVGGSFQSINGVNCGNFGVINLKNGKVGTFASNINKHPSYSNTGIVKRMSLVDDSMVLAGYIKTTGTSPSYKYYSNMLKIDLKTFGYSNKGNSFDNTIYALYQADSFLYYGGFFKTVDGKKRKALCRTNKFTNQLSSWNPIFNDTTFVIYDITGDDSFIYISARNYIKSLHYVYRILKATGAIVPFGNAMDSTFASTDDYAIQHIKLYDDTILIGGSFQKTIGSATYKNVIKVNKKTGIPYAFNAKITGVIKLIEPQSNGQVIFGGTINDIERQNNVMLSRYDLLKNVLDTWKINMPSTSIPPGLVSFDLNKNNVYLAYRGFYNTIIDGTKRSLVFKASKQNGSITPFNAKIPYNDNVKGVQCIDDKVFLLTDQGNFYKMTDGKDSFNQMVILGTGTYLAVRIGFYSMPFIAGGYGVYNIDIRTRSYNPYRNRCEKGMNNYPGTFTPNSTYSSVFYNYRDSIFYYYETAYNSLVNRLGNNGNYYRVNPSIHEVKKLEFSNTYGISGMYKKDSLLMVFGRFDNITVGNNSNVPLVNIFKYNEKKDAVDTNYRPKPNSQIYSVIINKNHAFLTGGLLLINRKSVKNLCAIDLKADTITNYSPEPNNQVKKILSYDSAIIISGDFYSLKYGTANKLAILDTTIGKVIYNFNPPVSFNTMHRDGNSLYIGGNFTNYNSSGINNLVRYNLKSRTLETSWNANIGGAIKRIITDDSFVYIAGNITNAGNDAQLYYARIRKDNAKNVPLGFQLKAPFGQTSDYGSASGIFLTDNLIYLSGYFELDNTRKGLIAIRKNDNTPTNYRVDLTTLYKNTFTDIVQNDDKLMTIATDPLNGVDGGNLMLLDRYQPITYPFSSGSVKVYGTFSDFSSSSKNIDCPGTGKAVINKSVVGNIIIVEKDSSNYAEEAFNFLPLKAGNTGEVSIRIKGRMFGEGDMVYLVRNSDTLWCNRTEISDKNLLIATFHFDRDSIGYYHLHVRFKSGKTAVPNELFQLEKVGEPIIKTSIIGYPLVRPNRWFDYSLKIENQSNINLANVPVFFTLQTNGRCEVDATNIYKDSFIHTGIDSLFKQPLQGRVYSFLIPELRAQDFYTIPIKIRVQSKDSLIINLWHQLPVNNARKLKCIQQTWAKFLNNSFALNCIDGAVLEIDSAFENSLTDEFGTSPSAGDYNGLYKHTAASCSSSYSMTYLTKLNQYYANPTFTTGIDSVCIYHSGSDMDSALLIKDKPFRFKIKVIKSIDPNDKIGPIGNSNDNFMDELPNTFNYVIRFENDSSATAPVQRIVVTDTIDKKFLDINSIVFNSFKVGNFNYYFSPGTSSVDKNFDFRNASNLILNLRTEVDTAKGIVTWYFNSLDIGTLTTQKLNPAFGFLPPNDKNNSGQGSVSFSIALKPGIGDYANIKNRADITFDDNKHILTPYWQVTKDKIAPESHVNPIPNTVSNPSFPVSWQGKDQSGIRQIEIYTSSNKIVYSFWKSSLSDSSSVFDGKNDSSYYFYSIATDLSGNIEAKPDSFDANTTVKTVRVISLFNNEHYKLYPNSSSGILNLSLNNISDVQIYIYTIDGKLIESLPCTGPETRFYIAQKGIYVIKIQSGYNTIGVEKVLVE